MTRRLEWLEAEITTDSAFDAFRDAGRIGSYCLSCPQHARSWLCPPLDSAVIRQLAGFTHVRMIGLQIFTTAVDAATPAEAILAGERRDFEAHLLRLEKELGGRACGFSGRCPYCDSTPCARIAGQPCRHPDLARPSLEACGFDVTAIASQCLHKEILWARDGVHPPYYMLVGAVFHNA